MTLITQVNLTRSNEHTNGNAKHWRHSRYSKYVGSVEYDHDNDTALVTLISGELREFEGSDHSKALDWAKGTFLVNRSMK